MPDIYLDYAAATPVDPRVLRAMLPYLKTEFANPSSIHVPGVRARRAIDTAREQVARLIGARPHEIVFTSGATESINLAILGVARAQTNVGRHIVTTATEHRATLKTLERDGFVVTTVPVDAQGQVDAEAVLGAVRSDTILVTVMLANNEIGTIAPIADIGRGLLKHTALFHVDAAQAVGVVPIEVEKLHVDLMSFSAAKMYGPKGVGALYVRTGTKLRQLMAGGNHEFGLRPGTENVPGIVGLGAAAEIAMAEFDEHSRHLWELREAFVTTLLRYCPIARVNGDANSTVPHIVNVTFVSSTASVGDAVARPLDGEELVIRLDALGIACSTAAACKTSDFPSHVLRAIGLSEAEIKSTVRFSFGRPTTIAQAKKSAKLVAKTVDQLAR